MNPRDKQKLKHNKQVFNQENSAFVLYLEKTMREEITVADAIRTLNIDSKEWDKLEKQYVMFNGLNK